jgi:hypothetical protein
MVVLGAFLLYNVHNMLLADLLKHYKPIYPPSHEWIDTFALLEADPSERQVVADLLEDLARDGQFRESIKLEDDDEEKFVGDGTHRVYASHLAGMTEIRTEHRSYDYSEEYNDEDMYPRTITKVLYTVEENGMAEDDDALISAARSVKLSNDLWVTADFFTGNYDNRIHYSFWCDIIPESEHELLNNSICKRLQLVGINAEVVTVSVNSDDEMNMFMSEESG